MNYVPKRFQGLDRFEARKKIVEELNRFEFTYKRRKAIDGSSIW